jgi:hypothetical protein
VRYEFRDAKSGEVTDFEYPVARAPKIGRRVHRGGRIWIRIPSLGAAKAQVQVAPDNIVDLQAGRVDLSRPDTWPPGGPPKHVDSSGRPCYSTEGEAKERMKRLNEYAPPGHSITWDR